jgi:hypothetical protein
MASPEKSVLLGFDPGGEKGFGWCVLQDMGKQPPKIKACDVSDNAVSAIQCVEKELPDHQWKTVSAAAIDAPLFWAANGGRSADNTVRKSIKQKGCWTAGGTVQSVNSLRGACLAQGIMVANGLREISQNQNLPITEAHPKAFLWMMGIGRNSGLKSESLKEYLHIDIIVKDTHKKDVRDAAIAAYFAWIMVHPEMQTGWRDLLSEEPEENKIYYPLTQGKKNLYYWFPTEDNLNSKG